jgi:hypothetical protein
MINKIKYYALKLENKTPMHISQNDEVFVEKRIFRDKNMKMRAVLPATAMAGIINRWCLDSGKDNLKLALFENGYLGLEFSLEDSYSKWKDCNELLEKRYYNPINKEYGIFNSKVGELKYMVVPDTEFELKIELKFNMDDELLVEAIEKDFEEFIEALKDGSIQIGAKNKDGMGQLLMKGKIERSFDMNDSSEVQKYIDRESSYLDYEYYEDKNEGFSYGAIKYRNGYRFKLKIPNGLKISKDQIMHFDSEMSSDEYLIYASMQRGFLKSYFERLNTLFKKKESKLLKGEILDVLFGTAEIESKMKLRDIKIHKSKLESVSRCLLNELTLDPIVDSEFEDLILVTDEVIDWTIDLSMLTKKELSMARPYFNCLMMDMAEGSCNWGGGVTNGYGLIEAKEMCMISDGEEKMIRLSSNTEIERNGGRGDEEN